MLNCILSCVGNENSFITSGPGLMHQGMIRCRKQTNSTLLAILFLSSIITLP